MYKKLIIILSVILLLLLAEKIVFTSSDIKIGMKPEVLRASPSSEMVIDVYRKNMLGLKVPFSSVEVRFQIEEGSNLIGLFDESADGKVTVRSKGIEGEAILGIYSLKSGVLIKSILIKILPRDMAALVCESIFTLPPRGSFYC